MKKLLLLGIMLLGIVGGVKAQETEIEYLPGDPISLESIVSESKLVSIGGTDQTMLYGLVNDGSQWGSNQIKLTSIQVAMNLISGDDNTSYQFRITKATDADLVMPEGITTLYRIKAFKKDGETPYTGPGWNGENSYYLNDIGWTYNVVPADNYDNGCFFGITSIDGKENTYKITSYKKDGSMVKENIYDKNEWVFYVVKEQSVPIKRVVQPMTKFSP